MFGNSEHVQKQKEIYVRRLQGLAEVFTRYGVPVTMPDGGFYLWIRSPQGDGWAFARQLAKDLGLVVTPGSLYGDPGAEFVRAAAVQPSELIDLLMKRAKGS